MYQVNWSIASAVLFFLKQTDAEELVERGHAGQNDERVANGGKGLVILTILHERNSRLEFRGCVFRKKAQRLASFGVVRPEFHSAAGLGFGSYAVGDEQEICGVGQVERGGVRSEKETAAITPARQEGSSMTIREVADSAQRNPVPP